MATPEQLYNRLLWVADLMSGEFPQTRGCLTALSHGQIEGHCCLGVAAQRFSTLSTLRGWAEYGPTRSTHLLPPEAADAMGLIEAPCALWHGRWVALTALNDAFDFTLPEIGMVVQAQTDDWTGQSPGEHFQIWNSSLMQRDDIPKPEVVV